MLCGQVESASKSEEVDRILSNVFTNYNKDVHPGSDRVDGAVEVGLSVIPLFIDIVSGKVFTYFKVSDMNTLVDSL